MVSALLALQFRPVLATAGILAILGAIVGFVFGRVVGRAFAEAFTWL
jgi:membrane protein DedA with SNARE-associated domain